MNSLNGGAAPAAPAPKGGPPIAVIVIVILVIIGIVVGIVMATRPAPKAAALPATIPPPPAAVMPPPPPPATVPTGSSPASSMGREMAVSAVIRTPDEMLTAKQAQADMRYAEPKLTNEQLAQAQRDAGKKVEVIKDPRLQENINTMKNVAVVTPGQMGGKIAELKGPQQAQESMKMGGKIAEVKGVQEGVKMGGTGITQMGKIAELKGPQQAQESMKMGGKIAEVKGVQGGMKMCPPGTDRVGAVCLNQCPPGQMTKGQFCSKPCPGGFIRQPDMACFRAFPYKRQPEELYPRPVVPMA